MRLQRHHQELTNGVGKCSKAMWQWGAPCFCDEPAYGTYIPGATWRVAESGELRRFDGKYCGYVSALACPAHGGPDRPVTASTGLAAHDMDDAFAVLDLIRRAEGKG